jgi:hypothetical protein
MVVAVVVVVVAWTPERGKLSAPFGIKKIEENKEIFIY